MSGVDASPTWWSDLSDRYDKSRREYIRHLHVLLAALDEGPAPGRDNPRWMILAEGEAVRRGRLLDIQKVMHARLRDAASSGRTLPDRAPIRGDFDDEIRRLRGKAAVRVRERMSTLREELESCRSAGKRRRARVPSRRAAAPSQLDIRA